MTIFSVRNPFAHDESGVPGSAGATDPSENAGLPFPGYDRLDVRQVVDGLSDHSQIELEAVESYERAHQNRPPIFHKLHYMRQDEPLPGYDALSVERVATKLEKADLAAVKRVRGYERKFANRPAVLEEVARVHRARRAEQPAPVAPSYQATSYN